MDDGAEELLAAGAVPVLSRRAKRLLVGGGLVIAAAFGVLRLTAVPAHQATRPNVAESSSAPSPSAAPPAGPPVDTATRVGPTPADDTVGARGAFNGDPAICPRPLRCLTTRSVPVLVAAAVSRYSRGTQDAADVVVSTGPPTPPTLYYREVRAVFDGAQVLVIVSRVQRAAPADAKPTQQVDAAADAPIAYVRRVTGDGYLIQVQFTAAPGGRPDLSSAQALAGDPRLLAPG